MSGNARLDPAGLNYATGCIPQGQCRLITFGECLFQSIEHIVEKVPSGPLFSQLVGQSLGVSRKRSINGSRPFGGQLHQLQRLGSSFCRSIRQQLANTQGQAQRHQRRGDVRGKTAGEWIDRFFDVDRPARAGFGRSEKNRVFEPGPQRTDPPLPPRWPNRRMLPCRGA